ncbi:TIGR04255 family protein [Endozoicomonas acroporae]|uniref:TIGR04255 family protein n=1 Tax=Endozoicomonas acroporae TaxID=1701104 RepID=UPI0013D71C5E|nr:TIGR04255 family protein [Endozoicomonas acroporae]
MSNYKKLNNQPLKLVLAEFRFSPVLKMESYIPNLQDSLRHQYPLFTKSSEQSIRVQPNGISMESHDLWVFQSENKRDAVEIDQNRIVVYTSDYPRFEGFFERCRKLIELLKTEVNPSLIQRIGLRYCDQIILDEEDSIEQLVEPSLIAPESISSLGVLEHRQNEISIASNSGRLIIRSIHGVNRLAFMPDVQKLPVLVDIDDTQSERIILDFDHFCDTGEEGILFEPPAILARLKDLHEPAREAFWNITTDYARNERWS